MQHRIEQGDVEPHVFDQTNGVVEPSERTTEADAERERLRRRTVGGIAMLSANRPNG